MKRILLIVFVGFLTTIVFLPQQIKAQEKTKIPSIDVKTLDGKTVNTSEFENDSTPYIINFWATWCKPCKKELNAIAELYEDWQEETGVKIIAISIDDSRNMSQVNSVVNGSEWEYEVYLDPNGDFKRAMNVNTIPHTFIINGNNEIVWQHNSYTEGDEYELYETLLKIIEGEEVSEH